MASRSVTSASYPGFEALTVESFRELHDKVGRIEAENEDMARRLGDIESRMSGGSKTLGMLMP